MAKNPPTVRMRRLGAQLRKIREALGLSLDEAADLLKLSKSALSRMENAQVVVRPRDVEYLMLKYGVNDPDLHEALLGLASAGRFKDWVRRHRRLADGPTVSDYVQLEQDSLRIRTFHPLVVHGLLQTPEYALAVMQSFEADPARDHGKSVAFRMARQEVLTRPNPACLDLVIGEAALRQRTAAAEVMGGQLRSLLAASQRDNVTVRVLPFNVRNPCPEGAFTLLDVATGDFTIAAVDGLRGSFFLEGAEDVAHCGRVFKELTSTALDDDDSRALIESILEELWDHAQEELTA